MSPGLLEQLRLDAAEHMECCTKRQQWHAAETKDVFQSKVFEQRKVWG
jgi:hypothetical protein